MTEALRALEADWALMLFERHSRGLEITHKGSQFLRHATDILRGVSNARVAFREEAVRPPGRLALGVTSLVAGYVLSDILARFRRAYPEVEKSGRSRTTATTCSTCSSEGSSTSPWC